MSKLSWKEFFVELAKNTHLINVNIENKVETLNLGGHSITISGNKGHIAGLGNFELVPDGKGGMHPKVFESEVEPISDNLENNIQSLDSDRKVFVLADIAEKTIQVSKPISTRQESIIHELKAALAMRPKDLGALLIAAQIIRIEDERNHKNISIAENFRQQLSLCYLQRGNMIYNLWRSDILANEILPHLKRQKELISDSQNQFPSVFLAYWDGILSRGYPTAHFVGRGENYKEFERELSKRFLISTIGNVRVFSRTDERNRIVHDWCQKYVAQKSDFQFSTGKTYRLGFGHAIIFTVSPTNR